MKPTTIALLQKCKQEKKRFATITAYDHSFAKLSEAQCALKPQIT